MATKKILSNSFISKYAKTQPIWGYGALSEITYARTYARPKLCGGKERFYECIERVVNGVFQMKHEHLIKNNLPVDLESDKRIAEEMYDRMFNFKILPPGRGLWVMGTALTTHADESKRVYAALNNCGMVSTENIDIELAKPFVFTMDSLMLGIGIGADLKGAGKIDIHRPLSGSQTFVIDDSREGWCQSLKALLESYFMPTQPTVVFDYSKIRPKGMPIKKFGGVSSGPGPLKELHEDVRKVLCKNAGKPITLTSIADIVNMIGRCVVSGNVRRSAEILLGPETEEFLTLKDWENRPERTAFSWCSNNSILVDESNADKLDYEAIAEKIALNGEPGLINLDNSRKFGRMVDGETNEDRKVMGMNPCAEQTLESYELCCLVETFISHHTDLEDYKSSLEMAFQYAKIVTLGQSHWPETNTVMLRNRRIGCSISGIAEFVEERGIKDFQQWIDQAYLHIAEFDTKLSDELCVRESIKKTSIKPSGSVSLLAGTSAGVHYNQAKNYIRRMRLSKNHELVPLLKEVGIPIEDSVTDPNAVVASFFVESKENRFVKQVSMFEQLSLAALIQKYYADNAVSCTITFDKKTETPETIRAAIEYFLPQLKCLSMLPLLDSDETVYAQMPLESISAELYEEMTAQISTLDLSEFYGPETQREDTFSLKRQTAIDFYVSEEEKKLSDGTDEDDDEEVFLDMPEAEKYCSNGTCSMPIVAGASN